MLSANCTICLKPGNILSLTEKIYKNGINETLKLKLCYIVPEVVCTVESCFSNLFIYSSISTGMAGQVSTL